MPVILAPDACPCDFHHLLVDNLWTNEDPVIGAFFFDFHASLWHTSTHRRVDMRQVHSASAFERNPLELLFAKNLSPNQAEDFESRGISLILLLKIS